MSPLCWLGDQYRWSNWMPEGVSFMYIMNIYLPKHPSNGKDWIPIKVHDNAIWSRRPYHNHTKCIDTTYLFNMFAFGLIFIITGVTSRVSWQKHRMLFYDLFNLTFLTFVALIFSQRYQFYNNVFDFIVSEFFKNLFINWLSENTIILVFHASYTSSTSTPNELPRGL